MGSRQCRESQSGVEKSQDLANRVAGLKWVAELAASVHAILVAATDSGSGDVSTRFEVVDNERYGTLGDPDIVRDVADTHLAITRNAQQHVRMV